MTLFGKIPFNSRLISVEIETEGEKIKRIKEIEDGNYPLILPGFIDVHTHGGGGMQNEQMEQFFPRNGNALPGNGDWFPDFPDQAGRSDIHRQQQPRLQSDESGI